AFEDQVDQFRHAALLQGTDTHQLAAAEFVKLRRLGVQVGRVALVGDTDDRLRDIAQPAGDLFVERRHTAACVHHEQDHMRLVDGSLDLLLDLGGEIVYNPDPYAARVDELEKAVAGLDQRGNPAARDPE